MSYPRRQTAARRAAHDAAQAVDDARLLTAERLEGRPLPDPGTMTVDEMRAEITAWWAAFDAETVEVRAANLPLDEQADFMVASSRRATAYTRRQRRLEAYLVIADRAELDGAPYASIAAALRARAAYLGEPMPTGEAYWPWDDGLSVEDARRWLAVVAAIRRPTAHVPGPTLGVVAGAR